MLNRKLAVLLFIGLTINLKPISVSAASQQLNNLDPFNKKPQSVETKNNIKTTIKVTDIEIRGTERKEEIRLAMSIKIGDTVTEDKIRENIQSIYNLGYFNENIYYAQEAYKDGYKLILNVIDNPKLNSVIISGNTLFKESEIKHIFDSEIGKVINYNDLKDDITKIRDKYTSDGYQGIYIVPNISSNGNMTITITEGMIEEIKIIGNKDTKENVIRRELSQKSGQIYNARLIEEDRRRLMNTNYFEKVDVKVEQGKTDPTKIVVVFVIKEQLTGTFLPGIAYSVQNGLTGNVELNKNNLFGNGQNLGLNLSFGGGWFAATSGFNFLGRVDWSDPWFLPEILSARTGFGVSLYRQRESNLFQTINPFNAQVNDLSSNYIYPLNNDRTGLGISFSRSIFGDPLTSPLRASISLKAESLAPTIPSLQDTQLKQGNDIKSYNELGKSTDPKVKSNLASLNQQFNDYTDINIRKGLTLSQRGYDNRFDIGLSINYDTRDFAAQPHDGWNNILLIDPSFGDISSIKFFGTVNKFTPVPYLDFLTLGLSAKVGILTGEKISIYDRFYSNGNDSIRGWPENGYLNGERLFIGSAELRFPIYNVVSGVAFFDAGNFWNQNWQVTNSNVNGEKINGTLRDQSLLNPLLRYGFGLGVRVNTPLGLFRLDYGIRDIKKPFDMATGAQIHFNVGQKF